MGSKRGVYRTRQERPFLRATLEVAGQAPRRGHVLDLSSRGAGLQLEPGAEPLAEGSEAVLRLEALVLLQPLQAPVRVRQWLAGDSPRCGLQFLQPNALEAEVPFVLRSQFNRRSAPRVALAEPVPVEVTATGGDEPIEARLRDVSTGGLRLRCRPTDADAIAGWSAVRVAFTLPGRPLPLCLPARVCARQGNDVRLAFDADLEARRPEIHDALADFVLERLPEGGDRSRS